MKFRLINLNMIELNLGSAITNQTAREYLEKMVFPDLRSALHNVSLISYPHAHPEPLSQLLTTINQNGELEKYWQEVEKKNEEARRAARRLEKERKRLEMGSDYETTGSTDEDGPDEFEDDEDSDDLLDSEEE